MVARGLAWAAACALVVGSSVTVAGCGSAMRQAPPGSGDDSVSVGFGRQERGSLSTAVGTVTGDEAATMQPTRVQDMLRRVPGVEVLRLANGALSVRIRGANDFRGAGEPLFIIDGMPVPHGGISTALDGIAPRDVDRIDVLKDAGATAIYGSQGANGVVIIVTRHGS